MLYLHTTADDGFFEDDDEARVSIEADESRDQYCPGCGEYIEDRTDHAEDCEEPEWEPETSVSDFFNGAGVRVTDENGRREVQVWVSVADPRGAFCMTLEIMPDGSTRLNVPTPSDSMPHAKLTALGSPGYYQIGG